MPTYTDAEARRKGCYRGLGIRGPGTARACLGTDCMAWRWASRQPASALSMQYIKFRGEDGKEVPVIGNFGMEEPTRPDGVPADWPWGAVDYNYYGWFEVPSSRSFQDRIAESNADRRGYCGAVGKPEHWE